VDGADRGGGAAPASGTSRYIGGGRKQGKSDGPRPGHRPTASPTGQTGPRTSASRPRVLRLGRCRPVSTLRTVRESRPVPAATCSWVSPSRSRAARTRPGSPRPVPERAPDRGPARWLASARPEARAAPAPTPRRSLTTSPTEPRGFVASARGPSGAGGCARRGFGAGADNPLGIHGVSALRGGGGKRATKRWGCRSQLQNSADVPQGEPGLVVGR